MQGNQSKRKAEMIEQKRHLTVHCEQISGFNHANNRQQTFQRWKTIWKTELAQRRRMEINKECGMSRRIHSEITEACEWLEWRDAEACGPWTTSAKREFYKPIVVFYCFIVVVVVVGNEERDVATTTRRVVVSGVNEVCPWQSRNKLGKPDLKTGNSGNCWKRKLEADNAGSRTRFPETTEYGHYWHVRNSGPGTVAGGV